MQFADIIVPLSVGGNFTYSVPDEMVSVIQIGARVEVPFRSKLYTGIVKKLHNESPNYPNIKSIIHLIDIEPILNTIHVQLWQWMANYYMCHEGDIMQFALPAHLKLDSETLIVKNETAQIDLDSVSDEEYLIMEALDKNGQLLLHEVQKILDNKNTRRVLNKLIERQYILTSEFSKDKYNPVFEKYVVLNPQFDNEYSLKKVFTTLEKTTKQLQLFLSYLHISDRGDIVTVKHLLQDAKATSIQLKALVDKQILIVEQRRVYRHKYKASDILNQFILSKEQTQVFDRIRNYFKQGRNVLLHGITGCGKTNIYIDLAKEIIQQGKQVLYLVPEIALTTQLTQRLTTHFGEMMGVYHSKFSDNERVETWQRVGNKNYKIILGSRSSLFLPFSDLGLIIIDEEHDASYKQETTPRYHARDAALVLAAQLKIPVLLGSATPALETLYNVEQKKIEIVLLNTRYNNIPLPDIILENNKEAVSTQSKAPIFSPNLIKAIQETLVKKQQVIIFQNRRGFAPYLYCGSCGWHAHCSSCDVSLTYHKSTDKMHCHICGNKYAIPKLCPNCKENKLFYKSYGTERIEEEIIAQFPNAQVARLDTDVARTTKKMQQIITAVASNSVNILVGTQMVVKGLDFENVKLVAVLSAESLLSFPDFRVNEKAIQTLLQVAGRSGRKDEKGRVIIQTIRPNTPLLQFVVQHDYMGFYQQEMEYRKHFSFPPFVKCIKLMLKHRDILLVKEAAIQLAQMMDALVHTQILGPAEPPVNRIMNKYLQEIIIKTSKDTTTLQSNKFKLKELIQTLTATRKYATVQVVVDVDPV